MNNKPLQQQVAEWREARLGMALRIARSLFTEEQCEEFWRRYRLHKRLIPAPAGAPCPTDEEPPPKLGRN